MSELANDPPPVRMLHLTLGSGVSQAIAVAAELRVADELAAGPRPVDELAKSVGAHPPTLYRLLRTLAVEGVFRELDRQRFELTEVGEVLRSGVPDSMRDWALLVDRAFYKNAWNHLVDSVRTGESAFEHAYDRPPFDYLRDHPEDSAAFNAAMISIARPLITPVVAAYPFHRFGTVVDVGGGHGALLAAVLTANPSVRGVLFDLPDVVAGAGPTLTGAGLGDRCECVGGDFFVTVPPGGDAYLLSNIVHDWDDDRAAKILTNCRAAMGDRGRLLLAEWVLPDNPRDDPPWLPLWADLQMLVMTSGGRQRTESEFARLLARAGLRLSGVVATAAGVSLVEAEPA